MPKVIKLERAIRCKGTVQIPDVSFQLEARSSVDEADEQKDLLFTEQKDLPVENGDSQPQYQTIVKEVFRDPPPLSRQEIETLYGAEIQRICREAEERAYYDALAKEKGEIRDCIEEVRLRLDEMQSLQDEYLETYIHELKYLAIDIAEKIILEKIKEDDKILQKMVMQIVGREQNARWIKVELSDRLVKLVDFMKEELAKGEYASQAVISPIAAPEGTCRITTESGTTVASVPVQTENLRKLFRELDATCC